MTDLAAAIKQKCIDCRHFLKEGRGPMGFCRLFESHRPERYWCDSWNVELNPAESPPAEQEPSKPEPTSGGSEVGSEEPPLSPNEAAILAHDEEIFRLKNRVDFLESALKSLARDIATLMKDRTA